MSLFNDASVAAQIHAAVCEHIPRLGLTHAPSRALVTVVAQLHDCSDEELLGGAIRDRDMAQAVRAGLLLRAELDDESHTVSQNIETPEGSFWHGIMHRREPDYSNSKYWFRRVDGHKLFSTLPACGAEEDLSDPAFERLTDSGRWDPYYFVDLCSSCIQGPKSHLAKTLESLQAREIDALFAFCAQAALQT